MIIVNGHEMHPDVGVHPVLFLDCDGVIASGNGGEIDKDTLDHVATVLRQADAVVVLCSDRVRERRFVAKLKQAGLPRHYLRGQCDPNPDLSALPSTYDKGRAASSKVHRVVEWLDIAEANNLLPPSWCVLDDARTFSANWRTCAVHVQPASPLVSVDELDRVWSILTRKLPHSVRQARRETEKLLAEHAASLAAAGRPRS
jgi:hypothetical protein